jgi:hypothetical protein
LQTVYDYDVLANWAQIHRDRVDAMMLTSSFCAGFQ